MEKRDIPVESLEQDEFGIGRYVKALCKFIRDSDTPMTIALQGEWGSGKTSFMKMIETSLCSAELPQEDRYDSIWLHTWDLFLENDYDTAVKKLITSLFSQMEEHFDTLHSKQKSEQRIKLMKEYVKGISSMMLTAVNVELEASGKVLDQIFGGNSTASVRKLKRDFENYVVREVNERDNGVTDQAFLIFVDDLDRLEPRMAVTLLEALKNLFDIEKCIFILSIDYDVVAMGIEQKYGVSTLVNRNIGQDFFDKLIQVPYVLPVAKYDISDMVMSRLKEIGFFEREYDYVKYEGKIVEIVQLATNKNPRAIKRLLNMIHLLTAMEIGEAGRHAELRMMEILLMALQMTFPKVYNMLARNNNLDTWKRRFHVPDSQAAISDHIRQQYDLDEEWKEIIYLTVAQDEVIRRNYYRIARLLEIYENLQDRCHRVGERVEDALGIVNVMCMNNDNQNAVKYDGEAYDKSSQTQYRQGARLVNSIDFSCYTNVLDVGCGNGSTTLDMWNQNRDMHVFAFDLAASQIDKAREKYEEIFLKENTEEFKGDIDFEVMNALDLKAKAEYDLVFSNATLHWITDEKRMYSLLFEALEPGGTLAVHQGGYGTYAGLHQMARDAIRNIGLEEKFKRWIFPAFYPKKEEMELLLREIGFTDIRVESVYSDEKDNENLVDNFAKASLIFYRQAALTDDEYEALEAEYFRLCKTEPVNKSSHRLYIYAERPKEKRTAE
ncbi:MAG: P-loop NTPase fold protein [Eubacteriales bacterium]|nr:P-loop NTPase fold protein [Eubacteriales bacterium]